MPEIDEKKGKTLDIELSEAVAEGTYSNLAIITHSHAEFVVDFIRMMPGMPKANVKSRIILTPQHAKRLLLALHDNVTKFESVYGEIENGETEVLPQFNLGNSGIGEA